MKNILVMGLKRFKDDLEDGGQCRVLPGEGGSRDEQSRYSVSPRESGPC